MQPLFCSFFTPSYADEAAGLVESLDAFGLRHDVVGVPSLGKWEKNCGYKPSFLLGMMDKWPGCPLVWLDADARVRKPPTLFDSLDCDVAFHLRRGSELLSGTLFIGPTSGGRRVLTRWKTECAFFPDKWDQLCLQIALDTLDGIKVEILPGAYTRIFDASDMGEEICIEHRQASRRLRSTA